MPLKIVALTDTLAVAPQIVPGDIPAIATAGYRVLINNRPDGEEPGQLPAVEARKIAEKPAAAPPKTAPKKLSYKDQKRLDDLNALMPKWSAEIRRLEAVLDDPALYSRDPKRFDATMKALDAVRAELENGEMEWLELEEKRESLG